MRPRHQGSAHDVILTGLDEESDSTNEEMPPLEPLEPLRFCFAFWDFASTSFFCVKKILKIFLQKWPLEFPLELALQEEITITGVRPPFEHKIWF